jgi:hypothetical protein
MSYSNLRKNGFILLAMILLVSILTAAPAKNQHPIRLKVKTLMPQPGSETPAASVDSEGIRPYLLQFSGPIQSAWKQEIEKLGIELLEYIPEFAFRINIKQGDVKKILELPYVQWIGPYMPVYKLSPDLKKEGKNIYQIQIKSAPTHRKSSLH